MPKVTYNNAAQWRDVYEIRIRDHNHSLNGQKVGYGRTWAQRCENPLDDNLTRFNRRVTQLTTLFPILTGDRIIVGGCGFGYLVEAFKDAGYANCWGIDNSNFVKNNKAVEARGDIIIIGEKFKVAAQLSTKLNSETGANNFKWVITESLLESYDDGAEMTEILDMAESGLTGGEPLTNIIHMVMSVQDPANPDRSISPIFNQKTLAQWKTVRPAHSWVDYVRWEVG